MFTTTQNKAPRHRKVYPKFQACCKKAGIEIVTRAPDGREIEHVDIHSFRVTFATDLIVRGVDPKTVQGLLGHQTLEMTMKIYTKIRGQRKRQGIGRLSHGSGAQAPGHVIELRQAAGWPGGTPPCPDETGALP